MPRPKKLLVPDAAETLAAAAANRMLGQVRLAANRAAKANGELERNVVRAHMAGASFRDIAKQAGFGSHHKVQEIIARAG